MMTDRMEIDVAALNWDIESQILRKTLQEIEAMVHVKDEFMISEPRFILGWYLFTVYVRRGLVAKIVSLLGDEFLSVKDKSVEKKFLSWLNVRLKELGSDMHFYNCACTYSVCSKSCC